MNMEKITLESIIAEHKQRIPTLHPCAEFPYFQYDDWKGYQRWLIRTIRYININYPDDKYVHEFEQTANSHYFNPEQQTALLTILEALVDLPTIIPQNKKKKTDKGINITTNINNSNCQSQSQEQSFAVNMFLEAIKDDLTGKQIKELKEVVAESGSDKEKARNGIIAKLKSFGSDVAANIIANILTNPVIWSGF